MRLGPLVLAGFALCGLGFLLPGYRPQALGLGLGIAYGLFFRRAVGGIGGPSSAGRWILILKIPILILFLAGLGRLGAGALLAFPMGFLVYLADLVVGLSRTP